MVHFLFEMWQPHDLILTCSISAGVQLVDVATLQW